MAKKGRKKASKPNKIAKKEVKGTDKVLLEETETNSKQEEDSNKGVKLLIFGIVGLLAVIILVMGAIVIGNSSNNNQDKNEISLENNLPENFEENENIKPEDIQIVEPIIEPEEIKGTTGTINGDGVTTEITGHSDKGFLKTKQTQEQIIQSGSWIATDYEHKDIESNTYIVQLGDTLWEISEAFYGNGFDWVNILGANSDSIGFLPDGSQSLIIPGQILMLP